MRPLEILATLSVIASILLFVSGRLERPWCVVVAGLALLLLGCHCLIEGTRWQMVPIYVVGVLLAAYAVIEFARGDRSLVLSGSEYPLALTAVIVVGIGIFFATALPVFMLPSPTGSYKIGTQVRHMVDMRRRDPFRSGESKPRELMIQVWYPADRDAKGVFSTYRRRDETTYWNARYSLARTHAISNAAISVRQKSYPVVVFAPSWWGGRNEATFQAEQLASHGYIVVGMDHAYSTRLTVFPGGHIARTKLVTGEDYSSEAGFHAFLATADEQVRVRGEDAQSLLDELERINGNDPFGQLTSRIDLTHIGILGYSIGGGAAAQACWMDHRFGAGVDLDGMLAADSERQGTTAPFLFIFGGFPPRPEDVPRAEGALRREAEFELRQMDQVNRSLLRSGGYLMFLPGRDHASFADGPFYSPLNSVSRSSGVGAETAARVISRYVISFFDRQFGRPTDDTLSHPPTEVPGSALKEFAPGG